MAHSKAAPVWKDFVILPLIKVMLAIRIYIATLTLLFLLLVIAQRGLGLLEGVVITCAILYLILDVRTELQELKAELGLLRELEQRVAELLR